MGAKISTKRLTLMVGKEIRYRPSFFFIPLLLSCFLCLLGIASFKSADNVMKIALTYKRFSLLIIISMAVCWEATYIKKYVEDSSAELFFLYGRNYRYMTMISMSPLYLLMLTPYFVVSKIYCTDFNLFVLWIIITIFYIFSSTCSLAFITNSTTTTVMIMIVYIFTSFVLPDKYNMFPFLFNSLGYDFVGEFTKVYLPMLFASIIVLILGYKIGKYRMGGNVWIIK